MLRLTKQWVHVMIGSTDNMVMPVAPFGGGYVGGSGSGFGGDFSSWIILFLIFAMFGNGWGNGFGGGDGGLYPWMNQSNQMNDGFRDQMINSTINGIQTGVTTGFGDVQNSLCNGFAGVNAAITNAQMANLERSFAAQSANSQALNSLQSQLASCCCDTRASIADAKYTIANEACATRTTDSQNTQNILNAINNGIQSIKDDLCADRLADAQRENADLRSQLQMAQLSASQNAQTAAIQAGQRTLANEIEQYVLPTPRPAYVVANPNCCAQPYGCGYVA